MINSDDVGMGYSEHMKSAIVLSFLFGLSSMQLIIQAILSSFSLIPEEGC